MFIAATTEHHFTLKNTERKKLFYIFFLWEAETGLLSRLLRHFEVGVQKHPRLFTRGTVAYYLNAKKVGKIYIILAM